MLLHARHKWIGVFYYLHNLLAKLVEKTDGPLDGPLSINGPLVFSRELKIQDILLFWNAYQTNACWWHSEVSLSKYVGNLHTSSYKGNRFIQVTRISIQMRIKHTKRRHKDLFHQSLDSPSLYVSIEELSSQVLRASQLLWWS